jgi:voltage-gated potassium channel
MQNKEIFHLIISKLRFPLILLIVVYSIAMIGLVLIPTYDNNGDIYYLDFFEAFFIVIYTSTTVGFGETPFAWTNYQKFWMAFCTISTVTSWLISVGRIITIMQDPIINKEKKSYFFKRKVKNIKEPFYIVAGFGNTGQYLSQILVTHGTRVVIIEKEELVLDSCNYIDYKIGIPTMTGDISDLELLKDSGILNPYCQGLILTTNDDKSNLKAALNARILNSNLKIISRSNSYNTKKNLKSFNTDLIVSPYSLFANDINNRFNEDKKYFIKKILTNEMLSENCDLKNLPKGNISIIGYKKFGKMLYKKINKNFKNITIFDLDENIKLHANHTHVESDGVSEEDLIKSDITKCKTLILTDKDDHKHLSSIITAKRINPKIFTIAVLNQEQNFQLYKKLKVDIIIRGHELMVRDIFPMISEPLLKDFFDLMIEDEKSINYLYDTLKKIDEPLVWSLKINQKTCPPIIEHLEKNKKLTIKDIISTGVNNNNFSIPLMILKNENKIVLPKYNTKIDFNDIILFVGNKKSKEDFDWVINNYNFFDKCQEYSKKYSLIDYISK